MMAWANRRALHENVASVPEAWLRRFAAKYPTDIRKFGEAKQCALLFRVSKVLECIENGDLIDLGEDVR